MMIGSRERESSKLNLSRDTVNWKKWGFFGAGILLVLTFASMGFIPVGTDAGSITVEDPVGTDLSLSRSSQGFQEHSNQRPNRTDPFPSMTRYQMSSVTPRQKQKIMLDQSAEELEYVSHTVKKGENIWKISRKYGLKTFSIVSANLDTLRNKNVLPVGLELRIPNRNGILTELKNDQTLWDLMKTYSTNLDTVLAFNNISSPSEIDQGEKIFLPGANPVNPYKYQLSHQGGGDKFSWPVSPGRRYVSSEFGQRDHPVLNKVILHRGIDIAAKYGTAIFASRAGIVEFAGKKSGYGYLVKIRHGENYRTVYSHMSRGFVREGQFVQRGQRIGEMGESGMATGPNLHFEIRKGEEAEDPLPYLNN